MNNHLKSKNSNFKIISIYYLSILLLTIYSTYKYGVFLYQKQLISFIVIFKPLILVLLSIFIPIVINYLYYKMKNIKYNIKNDYDPIFFTLITLTLPININVLIYALFLIIFSIIKLFYKLKLNYYSIYKLLFIILLIVLNKYSYLSLYDLNIETNFTTLDLFLGRSIGGLSTSNILLLLIIYLILFLNKAYKKDIPIYSFVSYFISLIIYSILFRKSIIINIKELISSEFIFGIILISTIPHFSPVENKDKIVYGLLVGILSFIFNKLTNIYEGIFIAIVISNIIIYIYQKLREVKK